jgi:hypothetical protein
MKCPLMRLVSDLFGGTPPNACIISCRTEFQSNGNRRGPTSSQQSSVAKVKQTTETMINQLVVGRGSSLSQTLHPSPDNLKKEHL